jgi:predicted RNase H-like HicB family nuclease
LIARPRRPVLVELRRIVADHVPVRFRSDVDVIAERERWVIVEPRRYLVTMSETLRMTITYEDPDEQGWIVARVVEVPGALSQGRTREEARQNVIDALRLMLSPDDDAAATAGGSEPLDLILTG